MAETLPQQKDQIRQPRPLALTELLFHRPLPRIKPQDC